MKQSNWKTVLILACLTTAFAARAATQDWPQWRGPSRDAKASGFAAPASWPKEITPKWKVTVGRGDASPAVVDGKVYVFARQDADELLVCLEAATGKEVWREKYASQAATEPMGRHPGPQLARRGWRQSRRLRGTWHAFLLQRRGWEAGLAEG